MARERFPSTGLSDEMFVRVIETKLDDEHNLRKKMEDEIGAWRMVSESCCAQADIDGVKCVLEGEW
jgi:hypothetical protein